MKKKPYAKKGEGLKDKTTFILPIKKYLKRHPSWNTRASSYPFVLNIAVPIFAVLLVFGIIIKLENYFQGDSPYLLFFAAIMFSAWYGGFKTAFLATIFSALIINFFFLKHPFPPGIDSIGDIIKFSLYFTIGLIVSILSQFMHNALKKLEIKNMDIQRSEEQYRLVVETVKDYAIYTLDPDGYITSWNEGAQRIKGYTAEEVIGKHFSMFYTPESIERGDPWKALRIATAKGRYEEEGYKIKKGGQTFWADVILTPLRDDEGKLQGFSQITRDMTAHKELDKRKDEFISIASHELKTPLTSLKVFNQTLQKMFEKRNQRDVLPFFTKMDHQIDKLNDIVADLLDVSRIQSGKVKLNMASFDLNNLITEVLDNIQITTKKHVIVVKGRATKPVLGDKDRIAQVFVNFISNAIKYSPEADKIIINITPDTTIVTIGVQDFGIGISKEHLNKIFEPFYRVYNEDGATYPGLGMGLHISSDIIERHNGKIWAESEKGRGSIFYFTLPYNQTID